MGKAKQLRTKQNKNNKENRTYEQNIKQLEYLKQLEIKQGGFTPKDCERLPGIHNLLNKTSIPKHFREIKDENVKISN